ncbi:hypothetical protein Poly41_24400 [Novipirellula artificiosorum]|uniref:Uncharacterized protein n=1 Tax=Novipirellula artificiosorum TaxID=2528016 RepID=A0A5C6DTF3_9BACT|nr:hypothetical protein Poly41_24400 [Novipirellula artificiosorum]
MRGLRSAIEPKSRFVFSKEVAIANLAIDCSKPDDMAGVGDRGTVAAKSISFYNEIEAASRQITQNQGRSEVLKMIGPEHLCRTATP